MTPRRLVTFVEGRGDVKAVPTLARRLLHEVGGTDVLFFDPNPFRVAGLGPLVKDDCLNWHRFLRTAGLRTKPPVGAILLVLDGEADPVPKNVEGVRRPIPVHRLLCSSGCRRAGRSGPE